MNNKVLNKRKPSNEVKCHSEPKVRKTENLESLTKSTLLKKFKELEDENRKLVSDLEKMKKINESFSERVKDFERQCSVQKTKSISTTQTVMLKEDFTFPCQICIYNADSEFDLRIHMDVAHDVDDGIFIPKTKCNICKKKFQGKGELMLHIKNNHKSTIPACRYYQKDVLTTKEMEIHL